MPLTQTLGTAEQFIKFYSILFYTVKTYLQAVCHEKYKYKITFKYSFTYMNGYSGIPKLWDKEELSKTAD